MKKTLLILLSLSMLSCQGQFDNVIYTSDKATVSPKWDNLSVKYHYNFIENAIISNLNECNVVLDIGPGYGHWIRFYQDYYNAEVSFIELSKPMYDTLKSEAAGYHGSIVDFNQGKYDVINAIGVLHHVIKPHELIKALSNIDSMLLPGGVLLIGTRVDFIKPVDEGIRLYRTLNHWKVLLKDYDVSIVRSDPPWYCRKHLDLIIAKPK